MRRRINVALGARGARPGRRVGKFLWRENDAAEIVRDEQW